MLDRERLAKVLALTASPNDSEALSAIRKANDIIKGENLTWEDVFRPGLGSRPNITVTVHRGSFVAPEFYAAVDEWNKR